MAAPGGSDVGSPLRRSILAGVAATAGTVWFVDRPRSNGLRSESRRVGFEIKTLPADEDPFAMLISRQLVSWFQEAGIDASVLPVTGDELLRDVLIDGEFDMFVSQFPWPTTDPDVLYALVHSSFVAEPGWQNPFGYSSLDTDEVLERQRTATGEHRRELAASLQEIIVDQNPFTVLAFPRRISASRDDRFAGLSLLDLRDSREYFRLDRVDPDADTLRVTTTDFRVTTNLNPINPEFRRDGLFTGFIYEPLAYSNGNGLEPWLARDVTWLSQGDSSVQVAIREDAAWHDDTPLTAADVAFTYAFLRDTTLGEEGESVPVPRYRGRSTLVEDVDVRDETTVTIRFGTDNRTVASRALTIPILPAHVWSDRTAIVAGNGGGTTQAIATDNVPPVGSGPLAFERAEPRRRLVLVRFEDHFTNRQTDTDETTSDRTETDLSPPYVDGLPFDRLVVRFVGSDAAAVDLVANDDADATVASVGADLVPRIGSTDATDLSVTTSDSYYFAGYNARRPPFSNTSFRSLISRLIDRAHLVSAVFDGYAIPAVSPLARTEWLAPEFAWDGDADRWFVGENGSVDTAEAREAFTDIGYRYDEQGRLYRG